MVAAGVALAAAAEPLPPLVPERPVSAWEARVSVAGGPLASQGDLAPLGELAHAAAGGGTAPGAAWDAGIGGTLRYAAPWGLSYTERLQAGVTMPSGAGLRGSASLGGQPGWSETGISGHYGLRRGPLDAEVAGGLALRGEEGRATTGGAVDADASWRLSPRASAGAWLAARTWLTIHAPAATFQGGAYLTGLPRLDTRLVVAAGARGSTPTDDAYAQWAGLPAPGEAEAWTVVRAAWQPGGPVSIFSEAGGLLALAGGEGQGWLTLGIELRHGGLRVAPLPPAPVTFRLFAPGASDVRVAGSFNGWVPEPLVRSPDGSWTLQRPVERGQHEYVYVVDGVAVIPPEARRRVPDGLGGENGVFDGPG